MSYNKNMFCKLALCNAMLRQVSLYKYKMSDVKNVRLLMLFKSHNIERAFKAIRKRIL